MLILELIEPTYDEAAGTLTYGATVLGGVCGGAADRRSPPTRTPG